MEYKVGDIITCKSLYAKGNRTGNRTLKAEYIRLGQSYEVLAIDDDEYLIVMSTMGMISYHPSHFTTIREERKKKLKNLKEVVFNR